MNSITLTLELPEYAEFVKYVGMSGSHLRCRIMHDAITYYHDFTNKERNFLYNRFAEYAETLGGHNARDVAHLLARYNPDNQYLIYHGENENEFNLCYLYDNRYHKNRHFNFIESFIKKIEKYEQR